MCLMVKRSLQNLQLASKYGVKLSLSKIKFIVTFTTFPCPFLAKSNPLFLSFTNVLAYVQSRTLVKEINKHNVSVLGN